jgi:hypothetical protein
MESDRPRPASARQTRHQITDTEFANKIQKRKEKKRKGEKKRKEKKKVNSATQ